MNYVIKYASAISGILLILSGLGLFASFFGFLFSDYQSTSSLLVPGRFLFLSFNAAGVYLPSFLMIMGVMLFRNRFSFRNFIFFSAWMFPSFTLGIVLRLIFSKTYNYSIITKLLVNYLSLEGTVILFTIISLILIIGIMQLPVFLQGVSFDAINKTLGEEVAQIAHEKEEEDDSVNRVVVANTNNDTNKAPGYNGKRKDSVLNRIIDEKIYSKSSSNEEFTVFFTTSLSEFPAKENILRLKEKPLETFEMVSVDDISSKIYQKKFSTEMPRLNVSKDKFEGDKEVFVIEKKSQYDVLQFTSAKTIENKKPTANPRANVVNDNFANHNNVLDNDEALQTVNFDSISKPQTSQKLHQTSNQASHQTSNQSSYKTSHQTSHQTQQTAPEYQTESLHQPLHETYQQPQQTPHHQTHQTHNQEQETIKHAENIIEYQMKDVYDFVFYKVFKPIENHISNKNLNKQKAIANSKKIVDTLKQFNIDAKITSYFVGPIVTVYELVPLSVVKLAKIMGLSDNICLAIGSSNIRMFAPIPGKEVIGIEVPNESREKIHLSSIIKRNFSIEHKLPFILGVNIMGEDYIIDIAKAPHILIAGSTGSGKSVCLNSLIASLVFYKSPAEVRLILIDPKMVEFNSFSSLPHLLSPVVIDNETALNVMSWLCVEMERRYSLLKDARCKHIAGYNNMQNVEKLPYIVVVVDEYADLVSSANRKELESKILKLANMSRAVGIHLVIATQRPSANIITGEIKANIPTKISFAVSSSVDSRVVLSGGGAEKLLGHGDMLVSSYDQGGILMRSQGAYVDEDEIENLVEYCQIYKDASLTNINMQKHTPEKKNFSIDDVIKQTHAEKSAHNTTAKPPAQSNAQPPAEMSDDDMFAQIERDIINGNIEALSPTQLSKRFSLTYSKALKLYNEIEKVMKKD